MNLNELMTSDFIDGHGPDELVDFLLEFRKNYRLLHNENRQLQRELKNKDSIIKVMEDNHGETKKKNDILTKYLNRRGKLTWKERILGKIKK